MTEDEEARIRVLWEETPQSAAQIGAAFGVSKNVIIGLAYRRRWQSFNRATGPTKPLGLYSRCPWPYERTTAGRLDALNVKFDAAVAETLP